MSEYKRLTMRNKGFIDTNCKNCKQCKKVGRKYICNDMTACDEEIIERLAELEDKIENGTLIELGYHIRKSYRNHDDQRYKIILIDEVEIDKIGYDGLTKAEAEAKLKGLQNER